MSSKIKIYKGTVTAGTVDGALVTNSEPIRTVAIKVPESGYAEGAWMKLAIRCDEGFETVLEGEKYARVSIIDSTGVDKWQLALDNNGVVGTAITWGNALDFTNKIEDTNTIFWARARVKSDEEPKNDSSVQLKAEATIGAVD